MGARLAGLLVKELIQLLRDPLILILILWLYTIEVVICAYALSFEVENMPLAVVDLDRSPQSRHIVGTHQIVQHGLDFPRRHFRR